MATDTATAPSVPDAHDDHGDHDHPTDSLYWKVGLGLAVLTGLEVSTYFIVGEDPYSHELATPIIGSLVIMMVAKFVIIGAFFMHLKFDHKLFRNIFITGMVLAVGVYIAAMTTFAFWSDGYEEGMRLLL